MQALLITLGSFALILLLVRLRVPLAVAIVAGAAALGLAAGMPPLAVLAACGAGAVQPLAVGVVVTVLLLLAMSELMLAAGTTKEIVSLAGALLRRPAVTMAALPALIGLLPMPGGAAFSAPMVAAAAEGTPTRPALLSGVNYWFRHPLEYFWPLYPGVILAMTLTHTTLAHFSLLQAPLALVMAGAGLVMLSGAHPTLHVTAPPAPAGTARRLLAATAPIWIILLVWPAATVALRLVWSPGEGDELGRAIERFLPMTAGLVASLAFATATNKHGIRALAEVVRRPSLYAQGGLVGAVMVFQHVLGQAKVAPAIAAEMTARGLPILLVVVLLPALAGMVTGVAVGYVGTAFPIVLALVAAAGDGAALPYAVLAYAAGHLGMMMSPIHLCYVLSNRYFSTPFGPVYRHLWRPAAIMACGAAGYFVVLQFLA